MRKDVVNSSVRDWTSFSLFSKLGGTNFCTVSLELKALWNTEARFVFKYALSGMFDGEAFEYSCFFLDSSFSYVTSEREVLKRSTALNGVEVA